MKRGAMTAGEMWAGVDVGKEHHWVAVVDDTGTVVLSKKPFVSLTEQINLYLAESKVEKLH